MYSLSLTSWVFLLCSFLVCCTGMTKWTPDCGGTLAQEKACILEETECDVRTNSSEKGKTGEHLGPDNTEWSMAPGLTINTLCTGTFKNKNTTKQSRPNDDRWYPKLNISWPQGRSMKETQFFLRIAFRGKRFYPFTIAPCDRCFKIIVRREPLLKTGLSEHQVISLLSDDLSHCDLGIHPVHLSVTVSRGHTPDGRQVGGTSISFPTDKVNGSEGLPTLFRSAPCQSTTKWNQCPDLSKWTTPLVLQNSSCKREISVGFELAPGSCIKKYEVILFNVNKRTRQRGVFKPVEGSITGKVTFTNVIAGTYYAMLDVNTLSGEKVNSGDVTIIDLPNCSTILTVPFKSLEPENIHGDNVIMIGVIVGVATVLIIAVLSVAILKAIRKDGKTDQKSSEPIFTLPQKEPEMRKRKVFIIYCMENRNHNKVVRKLAKLLHKEGHCHVILDRWQQNQINKYGVQGWITKQCEISDKIIVVGSEAVFKFIEARRKEQFWPRLESAFPLSKVFPSAARALQDSISPHTKSKALAVTFGYTKAQMTNNGILRELTGNNIHYYLIRDLERLLLSIHDVNKYECGNNVMEWGSTLLETKAGRELSLIISEAEEFYENNPTWFNDSYLSPVPYSYIKDTNVYDSTLSDTWSGYYISDSDDESFLSPEDCSYEDIEETLNNTHKLIAPSEDNISIKLTPDFVGPSDFCSDCESLSDGQEAENQDSGYGMSGEATTFLESVRPMSVQSDLPEYSTKDIRCGSLVLNGLPNLDNGHMDRGLLSSRVSLSSPSSVSTVCSLPDMDELVNIQHVKWPRGMV